MDRTAKLYRLSAELTVVKRGMEDFAAVRPNPPENFAIRKFGELVTGERRGSVNVALYWCRDRDVPP
jgi:hypothetical protein